MPNCPKRARSGSNALIDISAIGTIAASGAEAFTGLLWMVADLFVGILISSAVLCYLMSASVRLFFGFVNPVEQTQHLPAMNDHKQ